MSKEFGTGLITLFIAIGLIVGIIGTLAFMPVKTVEADKLDKPVITAIPYNDTAIMNDITKIKLILTEDDNWEVEAEALAISEIEIRDYKELFQWMDNEGYDIVDREDIDKVLIQESKVKNVDVDDKDAKVVLELKVYYEDSDGDDKKAYIGAKVFIEEGEVEDLEFNN